MAKAHGKKARFYAGGIDLSTYLRAVKRAGDQDIADASTLGSDDKTFVAGMQSGTLSLEGIYSARSKAENAQEIADFLDANLGGDVEIVGVHLPQGEGFGNVAYGFIGHRNSIEVTSPYDDVVKITGEAQSNIGFKSGRTLKAKGEVVASGEGEGLDNGAVGSPTAFGGVGILQVFAIDAGKKIDVKIQHSADNISYADLITFASVEAGETAIGIVLPKATSVLRYVRAKWTLSGGKATFHTSFTRNIS